MFPITPLLWLLLTCSASESFHVLSQDQQIESTAAIPPDLLISLERTGCKGACAMYKLTISADGVVIYDGKQFVRTRRKVRGILAQEHLRQLLAEFEKADYFSLKARYQYWLDGCPSSEIDFSGAITSIRINGRSKTITHDYGCREKSTDGRPGPVYPEPLFELEQRIDEIVGTKRWTK